MDRNLPNKSKAHSNTGRRFLHSLLAVLLGNAVYFALLPYLPPAARHRPYQIDWGLAIDFWFCLVAWGVLAFLPWFRQRR